MGGSSQQPTQKTSYELSPEQRELMTYAMPGVRDFAASVPQRYSGNQVAPFTAPQVAGQGMALGAAGTQNNLATSGADALTNFTTGSFWDPADNPRLQSAIAGATRPIQENLTNVALPAIRNEAVTTGNFGGNRQGIAEGAAVTGASRAIGDTSAKLVQNEYDTNVNAVLKALSLTPALQGAQTVGATTTSGVGDVQQAMNQAGINQDVAGFNYGQYAPFLQSKEIMSLLQGLPGGTTTSTGNVPQANPAMQALGGAAAGASLGTAIMPGIGTGIGAGAGALLPFFFR